MRLIIVLTNLVHLGLLSRKKRAASKRGPPPLPTQGEQREAFNFSKIVYTSGRDGGLLHSDILGGFDPHHVLAIDPDAPKEKVSVGSAPFAPPYPLQRSVPFNLSGCYRRGEMEACQRHTRMYLDQDVRGALQAFEGQAVPFRKTSREDAVVAYISSEWVIPSWHRLHVLAARLRSEMLPRALDKVNVTLSTLSTAAAAAAADNTTPTLELFLQVRAEVPSIMAAYVLVDRSDAFVIQHYEKSNFTSVGCESTRTLGGNLMILFPSPGGITISSPPRLCRSDEDVLHIRSHPQTINVVAWAQCDGLELNVTTKDGRIV